MPLERLPLLKAPRLVAAWLADQSSLTQRLIAACPGRFGVLVQQQGWGHALPTEVALLGMQHRGACLLREVELTCSGRAWVFARTVIPARSLRGRARLLAGLGGRPLGALLFADPATRRECVEVAAFRPGQPLFEHATRHLGVKPEVIWGRRTRFRFAGQHLLVNEIFLPSIPELP